MRYFLRLAYNGAQFHGWQSQPNASSVQQTIEEALSTVTRLPISIVGAGRTDTGVNAREMFAHFDLPSQISDPAKMLVSLNRLVGKDIAIHDIIPVHDTAHARFDASERTYKYFVSYEKNPFAGAFSWFSPHSLDIEAMNEAAQMLVLTKDFTSFAKLHSNSKTNFCDVRHACWEAYPEGRPAGTVPNFFHNGIVFTITADRFLRNMVRAVVGTLVDVGRGKLTPSDFKSIIDSEDRCAAGTSMPGEALFLWKVRYPYISDPG